MRALITGGAGCIGSDLAAALLERGDEVLILDNFSSGRREHIEPLIRQPGFRLIEGDLLDAATVERAVHGAEIVWHLAANPDVKFTPESPTDLDLKQNTLATYNVLEAMRKAGVRRIAFASTSAVYGIQERLPIPEDAPCRPISLYGAAKLAGEALISAFSHLFGIQAWILRFANIVGPKVRKRGRTVIGDFIARLKENPEELLILGDGRQRKSYLTAAECIEAMLFVVDHAREPLNIYNLGGRDAITVTRIAELVVEAMGLEGVRFRYTGGEGGWPGDVPRFTLDVTRLERLGWRARLNSEESVREAIRQLLEREQ